MHLCGSNPSETPTELSGKLKGRRSKVSVGFKFNQRLKVSQNILFRQIVLIYSFVDIFDILIYVDLCKGIYGQRIIDTLELT